ncbi:RNA dependent RNA polymerase [Halalkalibacter oceani]|uniref:RNA dependent RNA polymerase n=1 Tax=Halalkalibacter oceani TaxID=1653776 RepID=UPI003397B1C4
MSIGGETLLLDKQVYIYSLDTANFYNEFETKIHNKLNKSYIYKKTLNKIINSKDIDKEKKDKIQTRLIWNNKRIKRLKDDLYKEFEKNSETRKLKKRSLVDRNVISLFDSVLTRTIGVKQSELTTDIIVVQTYFFQVLEQLIQDGFTLDNEKYICFTASAGQIRTKKTMFIKESVWKKHEKSLTCGLTVDDINAKGGMNTNKYLAYLALCNSATDEWIDFNIDRAIVVDDLETDVFGEVDYIDDKTFDVTRRSMSVPIPHTDGCGMILPKVSSKSFMVRLPFIKGLLSPFDFYDFAKEHSAYIIKDIYGKEWDLRKDEIDVIFTRSQFKMASFYSSWQDYREKFIKYKCQAAKCNVEEGDIPDAKLNYQMLQTLSDMTNEELYRVCEPTLTELENIATDKSTMFKVLGITKSNKNKSYIQKSIEAYPPLLNDYYSKEILKSKKRSMVNDARSAKLKINGKYTFIIPDLYAFCERIFLNIENPQGLLNNGEVYCSLYPEHEELDCLRSPHLYREHAVRKNVIDSIKKKWFITKGLYTSVHDLISRELQFDCDGDKSLVCADETIIKVAKRNMENAVPLYYQMATAQKGKITSEEIYKGLQAAYKGNIGIISNQISKIWNSKAINIQAIKWLTAYNNYVIDYAKTLYLPIIPSEKRKIINSYTRNKVPHFFTYAKKKKKSEVEPLNSSVVNKLERMIPNKRIQFKKIGGEFDYKFLLKNKKIQVDNKIIEKYIELDRSKKWRLKKSDEKTKSKSVLYVYNKIRNELLEINEDPYYITDVLTRYLYEKESSRKETLWQCFGDILYENLTKNLKGKKSCVSCGTIIKVANNRVKYCRKCSNEKQKEWQRTSMKKSRKTKNM